MARVNPQWITADMVDAQSFEALSMRFGVMSVPMTVVNGSEQVVGAVPEGRLVSVIRQAVGA
ncbi:MAG: thioredoxin family protein [Actinomycetia bacterium]|jgi:predicted DsbA family dithiol-disulfide isomerase|nr:thioredoxin family protein [Actinomycetes bacterium]